MPSLSAGWMSEEAVNHYYGVSAAQARPGRSQYVGEAGFVYGISIMAEYKLDKNWSVMAGGGIDYFSDEISNSSIVDSDSSTNAFIGISYLFD